MKRCPQQGVHMSLNRLVQRPAQMHTKQSALNRKSSKIWRGCKCLISLSHLSHLNSTSLLTLISNWQLLPSWYVWRTVPWCDSCQGQLARSRPQHRLLPILPSGNYLSNPSCWFLEQAIPVVPASIKGDVPFCGQATTPIYPALFYVIL